MYCKKCNKTVPDGKFCNYCGSEISKNKINKIPKQKKMLAIMIIFFIVCTGVIFVTPRYIIFNFSEVKGNNKGVWTLQAFMLFFSYFLGFYLSLGMYFLLCFCNKKIKNNANKSKRYFFTFLLIYLFATFLFCFILMLVTINNSLF